MKRGLLKHHIAPLLVLLLIAFSFNCDTMTGDKTMSDDGLSEDYYLKTVTLSGGGTLDYTFNPYDWKYTYTVKNAVTDITVTPVASHKKALIKVNGEDCESTKPYGPIDLVVGDGNLITVSVASEDGSVLNYEFTIIRNSVESENAMLSELSIGDAGTLDPAFDPEAQSATYSAEVEADIIDLDVAAEMEATGAIIEITINGNPVTDPSLLGLNVGLNVIIITITAPDGVTTRTCTLNITRLSSSADDAGLNSLSIAGVALTPAFDAETLSYTATVPETMVPISVSASTRSTRATVAFFMDDAAVADPGAIDIPGPSGKLTVRVTAGDGTTTRDYTVGITKATAQTNAKLESIEITMGPNNSKRPLYHTFADPTQMTFDPERENYAAVVYAYDSITLTARAQDAGVTSIVFNDDGDGTHTGEVKTKAVALSEGAGYVTPITIAVTAQDGITVKTYTVEVKLLNLEEFYWGIYAPIMNNSFDRWSAWVPSPGPGTDETIPGFTSGQMDWDITVTSSLRGRNQMVLTNYSDGNRDTFDPEIGTTVVMYTMYNDNCPDNLLNGYKVAGTTVGDVSLSGDGTQTGTYTLTTPWGDAIGSVDIHYVLEEKKKVEDPDSYSVFHYMGQDHTFSYIDEVNAGANYPYPFKTGYDIYTPWDDGR